MVPNMLTRTTRILLLYIVIILKKSSEVHSSFFSQRDNEEQHRIFKIPIFSAFNEHTRSLCHQVFALFGANINPFTNEFNDRAINNKNEVNAF